MSLGSTVCNFSPDAPEFCKWLESVPILIHGYAYAVPDGRGINKGKSWLKKEFGKKGHKDLNRNTTTIAELVDKFNDMLSGLAEKKAHVHYVNLREALSNDLSKKMVGESISVIGLTSFIPRGRDSTKWWPNFLP